MASMSGLPSPTTPQRSGPTTELKTRDARSAIKVAYARASGDVRGTGGGNSLRCGALETNYDTVDTLGSAIIDARVTRMLGASIQAVLVESTWLTAVLGPMASDGIVPLAGPVYKDGSLVDPLFEGVTGLPFDDHSRLYGDNATYRNHVYAGRLLMNTTEPVATLPVGSVGREGFKTITQPYAYPLDLGCLLGPDETLSVATKLTTKLLKPDKLVGDTRSVQLGKGEGPPSHPLLRPQDHTSASRLYGMPCIWGGQPGVLMAFAHGPKCRTDASGSMFAPVDCMSYDELVKTFRDGVLASLKVCVNAVKRQMDDEKHSRAKPKAKPKTKAFGADEAAVSATVTKKAKPEAEGDAATKKKAPRASAAAARKTRTNYSEIFSHPLKLDDHAQLRDQLLDVSRWIPMAAISHAERCQQLGRVYQRLLKPHDLSGLDVDAVMDRQWAAELAACDDAQAVLRHVFKPKTIKPVPPGNDAALFDVHDVALPEPEHIGTALAIARKAVRRVAQGFVGMVPDLEDKRLAVSIPWVSPLVTTSTSSNTLMAVAGVPPAYDDELRFFDMPPKHYLSYELYRSVMRTLPCLGNRQHQAMAVLMEAGLPAMASHARPASPFDMIPRHLFTVLHWMVDPGPLYPATVSMDGLRVLAARTTGFVRRPARDANGDAKPKKKRPSKAKVTDGTPAPKKGKKDKSGRGDMPPPAAPGSDDEEDGMAPAEPDDLDETRTQTQLPSDDEEIDYMDLSDAPVKAPSSAKPKKKAVKPVTVPATPAKSKPKNNDKGTKGAGRLGSYMAPLSVVMPVANDDDDDDDSWLMQPSDLDPNAVTTLA